MKKNLMVPVIVVVAVVAISLTFISGIFKLPATEQPVQCVPNWECGDWSICERTGKTIGIQTRLCSDSNNCNVTIDKPLESQNCQLPRIYDLSDFPDPFITYPTALGGKINTAVIVGNDSSPKDVVTAIDLAATLHEFAGIVIPTEYPTLAALDTEVKNVTAQPLILIGGPDVNRLTAKILGVKYPISGNLAGLPVKGGIIKLINNAFGGENPAIIVAGTTDCETRDAASVLMNYEKFNLTGTEFVTDEIIKCD